METINVLVVDDSNIVHVLLGKIFDEHDDIKIAGDAYDGEEGLKLTRQLKPDIIIMDINMPGLNGLQAIEEIMHDCPTPIIVFSSASQKIVNLSFKAIELGAVDIVEKPLAEDLTDLRNIINSRLIRSIKSFHDFKVMRRIKKISSKENDKPIKIPHKRTEKIKRSCNELDNQNFPIIGIAASTGGPKTVKKLLGTLKFEKLNAGIIVVQHMAEGFFEGYSDWLNESCTNPVSIAKNGKTIDMNSVYIAPGGFHLTFNNDGTFNFLDEPPIYGIRPSADIMFSSMAKVFKKRAIGIVLTGMGSDGTKGLTALKDNGGHVIAQDEESSLIFGMPKSAIDAGIVDDVCNLDDIGLLLEGLCNE